MAHLSLYRKFRPDTFERMVRQEHVVRVLKNQIESGAVGHAYLFCGPRGTGKTSVARIFARAVNCEHPKNGSPCGTCPSCRALSEGSLDISEIDAASNNGVGEMRDLREKVQYPPVTGKYKVYIIDEVHMLTDSAFNALLKTLEEPPAHAIFILATTEPHKIPATILSRCMRLDFKLIPEEDLENHLISILEEIGKPYEREAVSAIARAGAGSDRDMLSIAEMCLAYGEELTYEGVTAVLGAADFMETSALCEALLLADMPSVLEKTEKILSEGKSVGVLCRDILETLNRIAVAKTCRTAEKLLVLPKKNFARIAEIAEKADGRAILRATELLAKAETDLKFVSSPRICLETALMKVAVPAADDGIDALLVRINALEKKLQEGAFSAGSLASALKRQEPQRKEPLPEPPPAESNDFPMEEPVFEEAYFSDEPPIEKKPEPKKEIKTAPVQRETEPAPAPQQSAPAPRQSTLAPQRSAPAEGMTAELIFGKFLRLLRKTNKGVLYTMCADLETLQEGARLILLTTSETIHRSLNRDDNRRTLTEVFSQLGIAEYEVRLKTTKEASGKSAVEQLRRDFKDYPIEIK